MTAEEELKMVKRELALYITAMNSISGNAAVERVLEDLDRALAKLEKDYRPIKKLDKG